jgi:hypothetical protein
LYKVTVETVVCDWGIYENDELKLVLNCKSNAELIKRILEADAQNKQLQLNNLED